MENIVKVRKNKGNKVEKSAKKVGKIFADNGKGYNFAINRCFGSRDGGRVCFDGKRIS